MTKLNTAFYLIDDAQHQSWPFPCSGWDYDNRGSAGDESIHPTRQVRSVSDKLPVCAKRDFTRQTEGSITLEYCFSVVSGNGFYIELTDGDTEGFRLVYRDGALLAGDKEICKCSPGEQKHFLKEIIDIDNRCVEVVFDKVSAGRIPFTGKAKALSSFRCGFARKDVGDANYTYFTKLYKNYLVNDCCVNVNPGDLSCEYEISGLKNAKISMQTHRYDGCPDMSFCFDAKKKAAGSFGTQFKKASGVVCFEVKYLLRDENASVAVNLMSKGEKALTLSDNSKSLMCSGGVLKIHSFDVWQVLRVEANTDDSTAIVKLNGKKVSVIPFDIKVNFFDGISVDFGAEDKLKSYVADIMVFVIPPEPKDYCPEPVIPKKKGDYYVGMNICSLWRTGDHCGWDTITPFEEIKPVLGYYDEGIPEVADWEIKFMAEHGIDYESYCWYIPYCDAPIKKTYLASSIYGGHFNAKYSDKVKLALLWEIANGAHPSREQYRKYVVPFFIDYFFSDDRYMQIDGTAIMSTFGTLEADFGSREAVKEEFDYLRSEVRKLGYKDLAILLCADASEEVKAMGIDGVQAYNWSNKGYDVDYTKECIMNNVNRNVMHVVPTISSGFNNIGWAGTRFPNMEVNDLEHMLNWTKEEVLSKNDPDSWKSKLIILSTWNEYGEGTYMAPSGLNKFGYMDAIRRAMLEDVPHVDVEPDQDQLKRLDILHPVGRGKIAKLCREEFPLSGEIYRKFEFKTKEDMDKWEFVGFDSVEIKDGKLVGKSSSHDPYMILKEETNIKAGDVARVIVKIRAYKPVNSTCCIEFKYSNKNDKEINGTGPMILTDPKKSVELIVPLYECPTWTGKITKIRLDPIYAAGDFELESIVLEKAVDHVEVKLNGEDLAFGVYAEKVSGDIYIPFNPKCPLAGLKSIYHEWDNVTKTLKVFSGSKCAKFTLGSKKAYINNKEYKLKKAVFMKDGLPMISLNVLKEACSFKVKIDGNDVFIKTK